MVASGEAQAIGRFVAERIELSQLIVDFLEAGCD